MVNEGNETQPHVLSWSADGEVFEIKDIRALKDDLFPKYHGATKFESFTRRLRRYGFHREKMEPVTKAGQCNTTVVLAFRHENFRRDRPDLLANLAIVPHLNNEALNSVSQESSVTCTNQLAQLQKTQEELKQTIQEFQNQKTEQASQIRCLRQELNSKDEAIRNLEFRLERLENSFLMAQGQSLRQPAPRVRTYSKMMADPQPMFLPFQPLMRVQSSTLEREMSAVGLLPMLDDWHDGGHHLDHDEPTLPRSKKMKLFHKNAMAQDILDGLAALSRQTTPLPLSFPCL